MWQFFTIALLLKNAARCQVTKENVLKTIYGTSKDYKNFGLADDLFSENTNQLAATVTRCSDLTEEKCRTFPSDCSNWKDNNDKFLNGISLLIRGFQTKSSREYLMGVTNVASSLVALRRVKGNLMPQMIDALMLTFKLFGDASSGIDPLRNVLQDFRLNDLELDFQGTKEYFELLLNPIPLYPDIPKPVKTLKAKEATKETFKGYTEGAVREILDKAQEQLWIFWRLSGLISEYCHNRAIEEDAGGPNTLQKCLYVLRLYCELAQTHLTYLLKIIAKIKMSPVIAANTDYTKKLIYLCERRFQSDNTTLSFLFDPMTSFDRSKVIFELYNNPDENRNIIEYLLLLHSKYKLYKKDRIVICKEEQLRGLCREIRTQALPSSTVSKRSNWEELYHWVDTKSMFVPPAIQVYFSTNGNERYKGIPAVIRGPFKGLAVYSNDDRLDLGDMIVAHNNDIRVTPNIRICTARGWCDTISKDTTSLNNLNGIDLAYEPIQKIDVPDGVGVKLSTSNGKALLIAGPYTATGLNLCPSWSWNKIQQFRIGDTPPRLDNSVVKDNIVFDPSNMKVSLDNETKWNRNIAEERGDQKVIICTKPRMRGLCVQYGSSSAIPDIFSPFEGITQQRCLINMQSMKIPSGVKVIGVQYVEGDKSEFGPYFGPAVIDRIDSTYKYDVQVINLYKAQVEKSMYDYYNPKPVNPPPLRSNKLTTQLKSKIDLTRSQLKGQLKTIRD